MEAIPGGPEGTFFEPRFDPSRGSGVPEAVADGAKDGVKATPGDWICSPVKFDFDESELACVNFDCDAA